MGFYGFFLVYVVGLGWFWLSGFFVLHRLLGVSMAKLNTTSSRRAPQFTAKATPCAVSKMFLVISNSQSKLNISGSVDAVKAQKGERNAWSSSNR